MAFLGVFRDDFYNAIHVLTKAQGVTGLAATGTLTAAMLVGAQVCYTSAAGTSQTFTTDTAVNIIAALQNAAATAYKAQLLSFGAGVNPPQTMPNLFNLSWIVELNCSGVVTGGTLAYGTGVTNSQISGLSGTALPVGGVAKFVVTVTSPTTVNLQRVQ